MNNKNIEHKWISKEGYKCYITISPISPKRTHRYRCGYVKVDENNLTNFIGDYNDVPVNVHGGLTFGSNGLWGFDCAHFNDKIEDWTLEKVKEETNKLSEQLSKIKMKRIWRASNGAVIRVEIKGTAPLMNNLSSFISYPNKKCGCSPKKRKKRK